MSTDDHGGTGPADAGRGERADDYRDPTAAPPLPDEPAPPADATQPVGTETRPFTPPEPPPPPVGAGGPPAPSVPGPYGAPAPGAPYGSPPPAPYAAPVPAYGAPPPAAPYGSPALPPPPSPYGVSPYAQAPTGYVPPRTNVSALVLTILSGLLLLSCSVLHLVSLVLAIMALTRQAHDPAGSASLARKGWWAFGVALAVEVLAVVGFVALGVSGAFDSGSSSYSGY